MSKLTLQDLRRSCSELLAASVLAVFPDAQLLGGRETSLGFYYDFWVPFDFQEAFLFLIDEKMKTLAKQDIAIHHKEMIESNAKEMLRHRGQIKRAEMLPGEKQVISLFQINEFIDPCPGPYPETTIQLKAFQLQKMLVLKKDKKGTSVRISGTAFFNENEMYQFIKRQKHYSKIHHVGLGKQLDLFSPSSKAGYWNWHPKGVILKNILYNECKKILQKEGFEWVSTPRYFEPSLSPVDQLTNAHLDLFKSRAASLNAQWAELTYLNLEEGDESELFNSKGYFTDVVHTFCSDNQLLEKSISSLQFIRNFSKLFSFKYRWVFSPRGRERSSLWRQREQLLKEALNACAIVYEIDERPHEESGPFVELQIEDGIGRWWGGPLLRLDVRLSSAAGLPEALIVSSLMQSMERFVALLIEQTAGELPFWVHPEQVKVLVIDTLSWDYAQKVAARLSSEGTRVRIEKMQGSLHELMHQVLQERVPYVIVIGKHESQKELVSLRVIGSNKEERITIDELIKRLIRQKEESVESK